MNVLHITTGLNDGGAEAVLYRLISHDEPSRHHVLSLMDEGKYGPLLREAGARVTCLNMPRRRLTLGGLWHLWCLLRNERPDVVQTWMYHGDLVGGVMARLAGISQVFWGIRHTTLEPGKSARSTIWVARISAWLSHWVPQTIICCADKAREVHAALGYAAEKMVVIPNGYDLDRIKPDAAARERLRREWGVADDNFLIGMVGRFDPQKDHANLITALGEFKRTCDPFRCVLVGKDLTKDNVALNAWIATQGLERHVLLLGQRNDIAAVMNALDVHVLSSAYGEAFPNVLAEAMACGTPCVTTDIGDAARIVGDTGWVISPKDPQALSEAIAHAYRAWSCSNWESRQLAARQQVRENFSIQRMVSSFRHVWMTRNKRDRLINYKYF